SNKEIGQSGIPGGGPIISEGASMLLSKADSLKLAHQVETKEASAGSRTATYTRGPEWGEAKVESISLPTLFNGSPVETVSEADAKTLGNLLAGAIGPGRSLDEQSFSADLSSVNRMTAAANISGYPTAEILRDLIETYGVSGSEERMREKVK